MNQRSKSPFEAVDSTLSLLLALVGLALADVGWFVIFFPQLQLPPYNVGNAYQYWFSFSVWGILGFSLGLVHSRRRAGIIFLFALLALAASYAIGGALPASLTFAFAYPGFFNGAGVAAAVVLVKRIGFKSTKGSYNKSKFDWENPEFKYAFLGYVLLLFSVALFILTSVLYFVWIPLTALTTLFIACVMIIMARRESLRSRG